MMTYLGFEFIKAVSESPNGPTAVTVEFMPAESPRHNEVLTGLYAAGQGGFNDMYQCPNCGALLGGIGPGHDAHIDHVC